MVKKIYYKVSLVGDVIIEAADEADAIKLARDYFVSTGQGLTWAIEKVEVETKPTP